MKREPIGLADESDAGWEKKRVKNDSRIDAPCLHEAGVEGATKEKPLVRKVC